jgi:cytochrome c-type biogenesis protein CcmH
MMFWILAAILIAIASGFVLLPVWRERRKSGNWSVPGIAAIAALVPATLGLYLHVTTWSEQPQREAMLPAVEEMVAGLAERLQQNPNDVDGWMILGQSYIALGRYPEARDALRQAWQRSPAPDDELRLALGEAEALADRQSLVGEAGELFETVLANDPGNAKALWYGGLSALLSGKAETARQRWSKLLELDPPEAVAQVLREQLVQLGGRVAAQPDTPGSSDTEAATPALRLRISVAEHLRAQLDQSSSLFIFARSREGGPPVAVVRHPAATLPGEFSLGDENAMIPGRSLQDFDVLTVVARVSASGQPTAQSGDLFGDILFEPAPQTQLIDLVIDEVVP